MLMNTPETFNNILVTSSSQIRKIWFKEPATRNMVAPAPPHFLSIHNFNILIGFESNNWDDRGGDLRCLARESLEFIIACLHAPALEQHKLSRNHRNGSQPTIRCLFVSFLLDASKGLRSSKPNHLRLRLQTIMYQYTGG
jgi:hypothetical protein